MTMHSHSTVLDSNTHYELLTASPEDAERIVSCTLKAMGGSYFREIVFPKEKAHLTSAEELSAWRVRRLRRAMQAATVFYLVVRPKDMPEQVLGYAGWYMPGHFDTTNLMDTYRRASPVMTTEPNPVSEMVPSGSSEEDANADLPACMNVEVQREFLTRMDQERNKIWKDDAQFWYLGALGVDPEYQRRGIGRMLLEEGLRRADQAGLPTYLEATPEGALMYPAFGFEKLGEHHFFKGRYIVQFLLRPVPRSNDTG